MRRYERALSEEFVDLFVGPLLPLLLRCRTEWNHSELVPDLQLRENNKVGIYLGLTRVLELQMGTDRNIRPTAAPAYRIRESGVEKSYQPHQYGRLCADLTRYLDNVKVRDRYTRGEGRCQNWLSSRYGVGRNDDQSELLAIDREVVIGYRDTGEKTEQWEVAVRQPALELARTISAEDPKRYGVDLERRALGNELDFLVWQPPDGFFCIEVKQGYSTHGIYMAPLQVAAYTVAWTKAAQNAETWPGLSAGINKLVEQKRQLGLVAMSDPEWSAFQASLDAPKFAPAIVVKDPNLKSSCWKKMQEVRSFVSKEWPKDWGQNPLSALRVFVGDKSETALQDVTDACKRW